MEAVLKTVRSKGHGSSNLPTSAMLRGYAKQKFNIKACGKMHAYCRICKPGRKKVRPEWLITPESREKAANTVVSKGIQAGKNNPNWKGGQSKRSLVGWNQIRRQVRLRDEVCKICKLPPERNRKLDVHHIIPRRKGGKDEINNLVALHRGCHVKMENSGRVGEWLNPRLC